MIRLYPEGNRRFQFKAFIGAEEPRQAEQIAYYRERGAADFMQKIAQEMIEEQDSVMHGTVVKMDVVVFPIAEYEKIIEEAYHNGRRDGMRMRH